MPKNKKYGTDSRQEMERDEKQPVVNTGMPKGRFQEQMQVSVGDNNVTKSDLSDSASGDIVAKAATAIRDKVKVKPVSEADILSNETVGGVSLDSNGTQMLRNAAGALAVGVVDDQSKISYTKGGYRPDGRFDRKYADNDFLINNEICEQIAPVFEGSKPIQSSGDKGQGYFGRKQFTQARGKKNAGSKPQATLFDRSLDFVEIDQTVHTTGQVLDSAFEVATPPIAGASAQIKSQYPDVRAKANNDFSSDDGYEAITSPMLKSNYVLKSMSVTFSGGKLSALRFNEDRCDAHAAGPGRDQANLNWQIDRNNVANSTIRMQKELGRETTDKWSPLGYVMKEPYEYNMLAHDIEAATGAIMGAAYRANNSALSFNFNNKLKKDGADPLTPALDMFLNGISNTCSDQVARDALVSAGGFGKAIFNKEMYKKGSAAAIIAMFDTTGKYKTKASFANYQKSLKFFVQAMDNNLDTFHCKEEFLHALDTAHVFSTPDGTYNPMLPIYATRKVSLVNPLSYDYFASGFDRDKVGRAAGYDEWGLPVRYAYKYNDLRNVYYQHLGNPVVGGIVRWILNHETAWAETFGDGTVTMSCALDMLYPTLFGMILAAASQDVAFARVQYFKDYLFAGDQMEYIYPDLKSLKELNFKASSNLTMGSYKDPLIVGKLKPASMVRTFWPEVYSYLTMADPALGYKNADIALPFYFSEQAFSGSYLDRSGWLNEQRPNVISYPELRHGVRHEFIDEILSMEESDFRLCLDRAVDIPIPVTSEGTQSYNGNTYSYYELSGGSLSRRSSASDINSYMHLASLRYDDNSDGRLILHTDRDASAGLILTKAAILCCPRELGFLYPSFRNSTILTGVAFNYSGDTLTSITWSETGTYQLSGAIDGSVGYDLVAYSALGEGATAPGAIDRTVALQQKYYKCYADRAAGVVTVNDSFVTHTGMVPAITGLFNVDGTINTTRAATGKANCMFTINGTSASSNVITTRLITFAPYEWFALNRLFLPVNPFENCFNSDASSNSGVTIDPLEPCFKYGLCGFFGSDFTIDVYDRSEKFIELNQFYVEDDFLKKSLIMRAD